MKGLYAPKDRQRRKRKLGWCPIHQVEFYNGKHYAKTCPYCDGNIWPKKRKGRKFCAPKATHTS